MELHRAEGGFLDYVEPPQHSCDVCAGLLGFTPYDTRLDAPYAERDAWEAVALLTGAEPPAPQPGRRRCLWCARPARSGWCRVCGVLLEAVAYASGALLVPAASATQLRAARLEVVAACTSDLGDEPTLW